MSWLYRATPRARGLWLRAIVRAALILTVALSLSGCSVIDSIKDTIGWGKSITERELAVIDGAIARLGNANADWELILTETRDQLGDTAMSAIRNEITTLMQRTTEAVGTQFRCIIDMSLTRVRQGMQRIRNRILGISNTPVEPYICTAVPNAVDMSLPANQRTKIELGGFDVDSNPKLQVLLVNSNGTVDVSNSLTQPTHYQLVVNLGSNGVPLTGSSNKLVFNWQGKEEYSLAIVQPVTPVCKKRYPKNTPAAITYVPPKVGSGDSDFDGNGPVVNVQADLARVNYGQSIYLNLYMDAIETKSDWTHASGTLYKEIIRAANGWRIVSIDSPTHDAVQYTDNDHAPDNFNGGGPIAIFTIVGDSSGDDAGVATKVNVTFNEIRYTEMETGNCVSPTALIENIGSNTLSVETLKRFKADIPAEDWKLLPLESLPTINPALRELVPGQ